MTDTPPITLIFQLFPMNGKFLHGDHVAYWSKAERVYVRARVEEPYREMCSGHRFKAYVFLVSNPTVNQGQ